MNNITITIYLEGINHGSHTNYDRKENQLIQLNKLCKMIACDNVIVNDTDKRYYLDNFSNFTTNGSSRGIAVNMDVDMYLKIEELINGWFLEMRDKKRGR